jgi:hypothetical protein
MCIQTAETPKDVDVEREISKFKNGKVTGHDKIPAELVKEGGKELRKFIYELISKVWKEEII